MPEELIVKTLANVGVPAALCFYTLFEVNKNLKRLTEAVDKLERRIERLETIILNKGVAA